MWNSLKHCLDNETKTDCGDFVLEICSVNSSNSDALDMTAVVLPNTSDLVSSDASSGELSFARFLSPDFVKQPFVLASRMRKLSFVDDSQRQSTPTQPFTARSAVKQEIMTPSSNVSAMHGEVWGSPLKVSIPEDDFDIENLDCSMGSVGAKKRRPRRLGIPLKTARKIVSTFNINNDVTSTIPALVVLCDIGDGKKTALSGVKMFPVPGEKRTAKGLKVVTVTMNAKDDVSELIQAVKMEKGLSQSCQVIFNFTVTV
jgi:hypothetical protein